MPRLLAVAAAAALVALACSSGGRPQTSETARDSATEIAGGPGGAPLAGPCDESDGALAGAAFVFVTSPGSGARLSSGFTVEGCSRTFEATVNWRLLDRAGEELAQGFTMGGGSDGPGPFRFEVAYSVAERQIGHLEVFEVDASGGEGFPRPRNVIPLLLLP